eukprot:Lankesteria_metandrocarpae@DN4981_c0_g1_i1.p1
MVVVLATLSWMYHFHAAVFLLLLYKSDQKCWATLNNRLFVTMPEKCKPPAIWTQRIALATTLADQLPVKKVIDLGCGAGSLLSRLAHCGQITAQVGIDLDRRSLIEAADRLRPQHPLCGRYLPQHIKLFVGSLLELPTSLGADWTVDSLCTLIEVLEHLPVDCVDRCRTVIFSSVSPSFALVTTPNADFNVLYGKLVGFRHYDHKFEYSRAEFHVEYSLRNGVRRHCVCILSMDTSNLELEL